mgnify:FL=1
MNELLIIPQNDGFLASSDEKSIFFPNAELLNVGCKNCIWKLHSQCPYGFVDEQAKEEGICNEMIIFLSSLADKNSTLTEVWEKFHIYKARLQESVDYADFVNLTKKVKEFEKSIGAYAFSEADEIALEKLKMDRNAAKLWWARLNQHVITSMQKINDRESKQSDTPKLAGIHSSGTINFNITKEVKQLEGK